MSGCAQPRSGTMVPDKVPRKVMGGGFRAHSPPRSSLVTTSGGTGMSIGGRQNEDVGTPRSGHSTKSGKGRPQSSKEKIIKAQEQEAAEIEREYIKNLQQQVYYLELELQYTKVKPKQVEHAEQHHHHQQEQKAGENEGRRGDGGRETPAIEPASDPTRGGRKSPTRPSSPTRRGRNSPSRAGGANTTPTAAVQGGPYAAVAAVMEAAERACEELKRTRVDQMDEAATRAYEITASHVEGRVEKLEHSASILAAAVAAYMQGQAGRVELHQAALAAAHADTAAAQGLLKDAKAEVELIIQQRNRYLDEVYAVKDEVEAAKKELEQVKSEKLQLLERCRQAEDSVRALTLRVQDAEEELRKKEGSLTAEEEKLLQDSLRSANVALDTEKSAGLRLQREADGLRNELTSQREELVNLRLESDLLKKKLDGEKSKRAHQDSRIELSNAQLQLARLQEEQASAEVEVRGKDAALAAQRRAIDELKSKLQQLQDDRDVSATMRSQTEKKWRDLETTLGALQADRDAALSQVASLKDQALTAKEARAALEKALDEARRQAGNAVLQRQVELAAREGGVHAQWLENNHTQSPWASALVAIHAAHASTPRGPARN